MVQNNEMSTCLLYSDVYAVNELLYHAREIKWREENYCVTVFIDMLSLEKDVTFQRCSQGLSLWLQGWFLGWTTYFVFLEVPGKMVVRVTGGLCIWDRGGAYYQGKEKWLRMVNMLDARLRGLALYMFPRQGHCVVLMGKVLFFLFASQY